MHVVQPQHDREEGTPISMMPTRAVLAYGLALGLVLVVHGFVPGFLNTGPWDYLLEGDMRCLARMDAEALTSWCDSYGLPQGYPFLSGGPIVFLGWALMEATGLGSYQAYVISGAAFDAIALAGGYGLLRALGTRRVIALAGAVAYLISPTVVGLRDFGGTFSGIALLPALALLDLLTIRAFERGSRNGMTFAATLYATVKTLALFMDGYAFMISALVSASLWLWWLMQTRPPLRIRLLGVAAVVGGHLTAVAAYRLYVPAIGDADAIGVFRSMGVDLTTLAVPSQYVWSADAIGATRNHTVLWGDGSNAMYNYAGAFCAILACIGLASLWRRPYVLALAAAGFVALGLSLGPSLKIGEIRGELPERPTPNTYVMPSGRAAIDFPWARGFQRVPGVAQMRATYRWSALSRLVLIVLAALAVDWLFLQPRRRVLAGVVGVLMVIELAPNVPLLVSEYRDRYESRTALDASLTGDLGAAINRDESVFFMSPDDVYVDYLVNYLAPTARLRALNAGGDKNAAFAQAAWPQAVSELAQPKAGSEQVVRALESGAVDAIVMPYFHLRWAAYAWPPSESSRQAAKNRFAPILSDRELTVRRYPWFATIRLAR